MTESVAADHNFVRKVLTPDAGKRFFEERGQPYKVEILDDLDRAAREQGQPAPEVSTFEHGHFIDLCRGPHVESTGKIGPFKLLAVSGAYWRGDQKRPALQRVYGTVWSTQEELDAFLWRREEAKKRDHRKLGVQLDLFSFHDVSPGAAFWHPKGWTLYNTLRDALREMQARRGYQEIYTPPLVHQKLWEQSGHWDLYRDHMFLVEAEEQTFSLKPMNCPESTFVYRSRVRSYRDFPLRLSEYGVLHRNELSGVLSGLTRVRHFVTDDAHIYVTPAQIQDEILALMGEVQESYSWFGLEPLLTFGTRPEKALGDEQTWRETEAMMLEALKASGVNYRIKPGDGAFYAPKIDIQVDDALGREWQTATIQVDRLMLPERFDLHYVDENGERQRPVAIHRAIYGSLERFIGVITEHFAGAFPFWCSPVQAIVIPIADRHNEAGRTARREFCGHAEYASRWTSRPAGCRTRSAWRRSRKCRTCSCSVIVRSRHGRLRRERVQESSRSPSTGKNWLNDWHRRRRRASPPESRLRSTRATRAIPSEHRPCRRVRGRRACQSREPSGRGPASTDQNETQARARPARLAVGM